MRNTKRYLSFLLGLMRMFILTGCSSTSENTTPTVALQRTDVNETITKKVPKHEENTTSVSNDKKVVSVNIKVHFIDVGQADSILVQQGNSYMLMQGITVMLKLLKVI